MEPSNKLLDDFLEMKLFHCVHCKNLLQTPVMLIEKLGNVCYNCYNKIKSEENTVALENRIISTMLEKMEIPCENRSQGCTKRIQYEKVQEHKDKCIYQNFRCRAPDKCFWSGCLKDFLNHYRETHTECHFEYQNDTFYLDTSKEELKEGVHLLNTSYGDFFLDVNKTDRDVKFLIYPLTKNIDDLKYSFSATFAGEKGKEFSSTCQIVDWQSFVTASYDKYDTIGKISLECLDCIFKDDNVVLIKVTLNVVDQMTAENSFLSNLQCHTCKSYLNSSVFSCHAGHIFCFTCSGNSLQCCKQFSFSLGGTSQNRTLDGQVSGFFGSTSQKNSSQKNSSQNRALENIIAKIRLPCRFMIKGCRMKTLRNSGHDSLCYYKDWWCSIPNCKFSGSCTALFNHILQLHTRNYFVITSNLEIHSKLETENYYLTLDNQIFHLFYKNTCMSSGDSYQNYILWTLDIIGHTEQHYSYEIEINFKQLCMKFRAPCSHNGVEMPQSTSNQFMGLPYGVNVIRLPGNMLAQVGHCSPDLKYVIKIFKD